MHEGDRTQVEVYFFPGFRKHEESPVTAWSKDWVNADQVRSFVEHFQALSTAVPSTGSMYAWFSHDLRAAFEYLVHREICCQTLMGAGMMQDEALRYLSIAKSLLVTPKRERWTATLHRFALLLEGWKKELAKISLRVPLPTELVVFSSNIQSDNALNSTPKDSAGAYDVSSLMIQTVRAEDDYYCILGVSCKATTDDIKIAHRILARKYHPDRSEGNVALFQRLQKAFTTLRNPKQRSAYDDIRAHFIRRIEEIEKEEKKMKEAANALSKRSASWIARGNMGTRKSIRNKNSYNGGNGIVAEAVPMLKGVDLITASIHDSSSKKINDDPQELQNWYRSMSGDDPLVEAVLTNSVQTLSILTDVHGVNLSLASLLVAIEINNISMAKAILTKKRDLCLGLTTPILHLSRSPARAQGWTVLHHAALLGRVDLLRPIVDAATVAQDEQFRSVYGSKVIHHSTESFVRTTSGSCESNKAAIGKGHEGWSVTRIYARGDHYGMTALHVAAKHGQADAVRELINLGSDPMQRCKQKFTALHWICGEKVNRGHVASAAALMDANKELVNIPDKNGLTALHWANAEQHVGLMKLLLDRGASWSDQDLEALVDDVTLGHEHRPIKIDLSCCFEESRNRSTTVATQAGSIAANTSNKVRRSDIMSNEVAKELLSRLRRFVYIRNPVEESDETTNNSSKHEDDCETDYIRDEDRKGEGNEMIADRKSHKSKNNVKYVKGSTSGCSCTNCFESAKQCACVRKNGEYLPYSPIIDPETGAVTGVILEQERLGMMRTRIFECGQDCANHHRFAALDKRDNGKVTDTNTKTNARKKKNSKRRRGCPSVATSAAAPRLGRAEMEELRRRKMYEERWCSSLNFCQQGVSPPLTLKGFRNGKGFGVITDVPLRKGQYVCTYNAEIISADDAKLRETMWCEGNGQLGGKEVLPEGFGVLNMSKAVCSSSSKSRQRVASSQDSHGTNNKIRHASNIVKKGKNDAGNVNYGTLCLSEDICTGPTSNSPMDGMINDRSHRKIPRTCKEPGEFSRRRRKQNSVLLAQDGCERKISVAKEMNQENAGAKIEGMKCEVEYNGEWYSATVEFDRPSGRSVKCDVDDCSVIVPYPELKYRIRDLGGGASEAAKISIVDQELLDLEGASTKRKRCARRCTAETQALTSTDARRVEKEVLGSDDNSSCQIEKKSCFDRVSHNAAIHSRAGLPISEDMVLSASVTHSLTSSPTSVGSGSPVVSQTQQADDIDCDNHVGSEHDDNSHGKYLDQQNEISMQDFGAAVDLDYASSEDAAFVPGALMEQVTFQIYLDKSCNNRVFDGTIFANIARFMNHSCDPNLKIIKVFCNRPYPLLAFFCTRNVEAGEELTWNYDNSGAGRKKTNGVVCLCGADNCRGFL